MQRHYILRLIARVLMAALALGLTQCQTFQALFPAPPQRTFKVNSTADESDVSPGDGVCATSAGACTLRAAVEEANAVVSDDVIELPAGVYKLAVAKGSLVIKDDVSVLGAQSATTIIEGSGSYGDRVIVLEHAGTTYKYKHAQFQRVTVRKSQGGGFFVNADTKLSLRESVVTDNSDVANGGGIWSQGRVDILNSTISNNDGGARGGGIFNAANAFLEVTNSTIEGNRAIGGAGVLNVGWMRIYNSTLSGNRARRGAGGIRNTGTAEVYNSTITGNAANYGLGHTPDAIGGGVQNIQGGTFTFWNTIIAGNTDERPVSSASTPDCAGTLSSRRNNLVGDASSCTVVDADLGTGAPFDRIGNELARIDPRLGPLASNGGTTRTHALLPGSPAIDAGSTSSGQFSCPSVDQRGAGRPKDGDGDGSIICDIGAYER